MAYALIGSVALVCVTVILAQIFHHGFKEGERTHKDVSQLSEVLEAKIKSVEDMRAKVEMLLFKNGLGR